MQKGVFTVLAATAAVAAFWPGAAGASPARGVVVAKQHGVLFVASPSGVVQTMRGAAALGTQLVGTRAVGHVRHATVHGVVVRKTGSTLLLASNRHLLAIRDTAPAPAPGTVVSTDVTIGNGGLVDDDDDDLGQVAGGTIAVTATVSAVGAGSVTLNVQGQSFTVPLPNGLTLPSSLVGQTVTLNLSLRNDDDRNDDHGDHRGHGRGGDGGGDH